MYGKTWTRCNWRLSSGVHLMRPSGFSNNLYRLTQNVGGSAFSPDGTILASGDTGGNLVLSDAATGKELRHLHDPDFEHYQAFFLRTENLLATIGISRRPVRGNASAYAMHFWDPSTGKKAAFI